MGLVKPICCRAKFAWDESEFLPDKDDNRAQKLLLLEWLEAGSDPYQSWRFIFVREFFSWESLFLARVFFEREFSSWESVFFERYLFSVKLLNKGLLGNIFTEICCITSLPYTHTSKVKLECRNFPTGHA